MPCRYRTDADYRCFAGKSVCRECLFVVIQLQILCAQLQLIACVFDGKFHCWKITVYNRLGCRIDKFTVLTVFQPKKMLRQHRDTIFIALYYILRVCKRMCLQFQIWFHVLFSPFLSYQFLPYFENGNLWQKSVLPQVPLHFLFGFQNNCLIRTQFSCPRCCAALWIVADQYICSRKGFRNCVLLLLFCKIAHHEEFLVA